MSILDRAREKAKAFGLLFKRNQIETVPNLFDSLPHVTVEQMKRMQLASLVIVNSLVVKDRYDARTLPRPAEEMDYFAADFVISGGVTLRDTIDTSVWVAKETPLSSDFVHVKKPGSSRETSLRDRFERFHTDNPHVFSLLKDLALSAKANGHKKMGIKAAVERARWFYQFETKRGKGQPKINNSYSAFYARKLMTEVPGLEGFFAIRTQRG